MRKILLLACTVVACLCTSDAFAGSARPCCPGGVCVQRPFLKVQAKPGSQVDVRLGVFGLRRLHINTK